MRAALLHLSLCLTFLACSDREPQPQHAPAAARAPDDEPQLMDDGGFGDLVDAPGSELVVQHCIACHGPRQFLQQRASRDTWRALIRWMQRDHGMATLDEGIEDRIVDYLAEHYAPEQAGRRAALPAELMPPNPYQR
jgi:mono/diheme cytochrome c family protein